MRKINVILVVLILILLIDHIVFGGMHLLGSDAGVIKPMALTMLSLVLAHAVVSMYVTLRAEIAGGKTKARYNKENKEFWTRRTTGVMILLFALLHAHAMFKDENGVPRIAHLPKVFSLATPLLIISIFAHIYINVRPLLISLGIRNVDRKEKIIKIILTIVMLFALSALIYFNINRARGH